MQAATCGYPPPLSLETSGGRLGMKVAILAQSRMQHRMKCSFCETSANTPARWLSFQLACCWCLAKMMVPQGVALGTLDNRLLASCAPGIHQMMRKRAFSHAFPHPELQLQSFGPHFQAHCSTSLHRTLGMVWRTSNEVFVVACRL